MSGNFRNQISQRKFSSISGVSAANRILLKVCGNPPESRSEATMEAVETANISAKQMPETTKFKSI